MSLTPPITRCGEIPLGKPEPEIGADADHNGVINQMDYLVWQTRFAEAMGPPPA